MTSVHPSDDLLIARVLDELDASDRESIESHLDSCDTCRELAQTMSRVLSGVRAEEHASAPAGILIELLEAQAASRVAEPRFFIAPRRLLRPLAVGAAALLMITIFATGFWAGQRSFSGQPPASEVRQVERQVERQNVSQPLPDPPLIPFQPALPQV